jgi:Galactose oxidase, central domain
MTRAKISFNGALMRFALFAFAGFVCSQAIAAEPNTWVKLDDARIIGRRWDIPLAYSPELKTFMVLGGRYTLADGKQPRSYDVLSLSASGKWQNEIPPSGKAWGPESGVTAAPAWKDEVWGFRDAEGNTRPNWTVYSTFSLGGKFGHDPDSDAFYFYAERSTFRYYPKSREWIDLKLRRGPEWEYPGTLVWSSMSYDGAAKCFILFGGGNVQSRRGDPGTWSFTPDRGPWEQIETKGAPPARANSRLVYDPVHKVTILFGGDQLNQLVADTWLFDSSKKSWVEHKPALSPSPRGGHAFLWLPKAKKTLLLGGYTYTSTTDYCASLYKTLPLEAWTYDVPANRWELIARWEKDGPLGPANSFLAAAVDENDNVLLLDSQNQAWKCAFDMSKTDTGGTTKFGVEPGATVRRSGPHDPKWYTEGRPAPDVKVVAERLEKLPVNEWVLLPTPNAPKMNMDWGSAVFDASNDKIVRFSGGHSAYSGTAPIIYDIKTDRSRGVRIRQRSGPRRMEFPG